METLCSFCDSYGCRFFALDQGGCGALNKSLAKSGGRHSYVSFCKRPVTEAKDPDLPNHNFTEKNGPGFWNRLMLAWKVLFPPAKNALSSSDIAKRRLKMIIISDRCAVNGEAKRKIVNNIVDAMSEYVEIQSGESVQLNLSAGPDLGAVYSVSVPIRRVKPQYQEFGRDLLATDGEIFEN